MKGNVNGHVNGHANGHVNGITDELDEYFKSAWLLDTQKAETITLRQAKTWIEEIFGKDYGTDTEFKVALTDGILLCRLINRIVPNTIPFVNVGKNPITWLENVQFFLDGCRRVGIKEEMLFEPYDVKYFGNNEEELERRNRKIAVTLFWLSRIAEELPRFDTFEDFIDLEDKENDDCSIKECVQEEVSRTACQNHETRSENNDCVNGKLSRTACQNHETRTENNQFVKKGSGKSTTKKTVAFEDDLCELCKRDRSCERQKDGTITLLSDKNERSSEFGVSIKEAETGYQIITAVKKGSYADKSGLTIGDYVITINGVNTGNMSLVEVNEKIKSVFSEGHVYLGICRLPPNETLTEQHQECPIFQERLQTSSGMIDNTVECDAASDNHIIPNQKTTISAAYSSNTSSDNGTSQIMSQGIDIMSQSPNVRRQRPKSPKMRSQSPKMRSQSPKMRSQSPQMMSYSPKMMSQSPKLRSKRTQGSNITPHSNNMTSEHTNETSRSNNVRLQGNSFKSHSNDMSSQSINMTSHERSMTPPRKVLVEEDFPVVRSKAIDRALPQATTQSARMNMTSQSTNMTSQSTNMTSRSTNMTSRSTNMTSQGTSITSPNGREVYASVEEDIPLIRSQTIDRVESAPIASGPGLSEWREMLEKHKRETYESELDQKTIKDLWNRYIKTSEMDEVLTDVGKLNIDKAQNFRESVAQTDGNDSMDRHLTLVGHELRRSADTYNSHLVCGCCVTPIGTKASIHLDNTNFMYHQKCFVCKHCDVALLDRATLLYNVFVVDGCPYCDVCIKKMNMIRLGKVKKRPLKTTV